LIQISDIRISGKLHMVVKKKTGQKAHVSVFLKIVSLYKYLSKLQTTIYLVVWKNLFSK